MREPRVLLPDDVMTAVESSPSSLLTPARVYGAAVLAIIALVVVVLVLSS
jgi:hypothetical protein